MAKKEKNYIELSDKPLTPRERMEFRRINKTIGHLEWLAWLFLKIVGVTAATLAVISQLKLYLPWLGTK